MDSEVITNEQGQVAVKWAISRKPIHKSVVIEKSGRKYDFTYNLNIALAWVHPDDVPSLLSWKEKNCNCGGGKGTFVNAFALANQLDVNLHDYGNREGKVYVKE